MFIFMWRFVYRSRRGCLNSPMMHEGGYQARQKRKSYDSSFLSA